MYASPYVDRETWKHEVLPTSQLQMYRVLPTAVSASAEDNSTQPIVVSADTNENSIHHEPTIITEPAITASQPQTKPSELMKHFFRDFKYFEAVNVKGVPKGKWSGSCTSSNFYSR